MLCQRRRAETLVLRGADCRDNPQPDQPGRRTFQRGTSQRHKAHPDLRGSLLRCDLWRGLLSDEYSIDVQTSGVRQSAPQMITVHFSIASTDRQLRCRVSRATALQQLAGHPTRSNLQRDMRPSSAQALFASQDLRRLDPDQ